MKLNRKLLNASFTKAVLIFALFWAANIQVWAQESSDIWVGRLNLNEKHIITDLVQITNNAQYTNQPYFFGNENLLFTQALSDAEQNSQMDIMRFDFNTGETKNLTESSESEYSPTPLPGRSGMSVIRVNSEGKQELWEINEQGKLVQHLVPLVEPVGYQVWLNDHELLLFVLGEPHTLQRVDTKLVDKGGIYVDKNIGASLARFKQSDWFIYKSANDGEFLNAYNASTQTISQLFSLPQNIDYFTTTVQGQIIASNAESILIAQLLLKQGKLQLQEQWKTIKLKHLACGKGVSRIAVSPDMTMIALVCPTPTA